MIATNDIAEPRYKHAKSKAKEVWENLANKKIPVSINDIVKALGLNVKEENLEGHGITRMYDDGHILTLYSRAASIERKRFTVAHELGHICLEHITLDGKSSQFSSKSQEIEANSFAAALLVPISDLRAFMKDKDKTLEDIIKRYWVSKDVATRAVNHNRLLNKLHVD